jgi:hypothetical protein
MHGKDISMIFITVPLLTDGKCLGDHSVQRSTAQKNAQQKIVSS